jgi:large subunit ribosomal protein L21
MKFAVIKTGGKQYKIASGDKIKIEKIKGDLKVGDAVTFDSVLATIEGDNINVGTPTLSGTKVTGTISKIGRNAKVMVVKYKQKSRYLVRNGHRQPFFEVTIATV